ncbi:MAG: DMT family transporter [Alphaproteobacteria bacterium]|nr:DMT family transporter [Alphaproteobacteria bacterium]
MLPIEDKDALLKPAHKGIILMLLTTLSFITMDSIVKYLVQTYPVTQVVWGRYTFHGVLLAIYLGPRLSSVLRTKRLGVQLGRSLLLFLTTALFFAGLQFVPLVSAASIMFVTPIVVTALSVPLLKEKVGPYRWAGVIVGFMGAMVIIRPGSDVMQLAALLPLSAAFLYALYQITTRSMAGGDSVMTTALYTSVAGTVIASIAVPFDWVTPDLVGWLLLALTGLLGGIGHLLLIRAFDFAPAATLSPFGYSNLIWATSFGYLFFDELPDYWTILGAAIIASSGLYIFYRESHRV